jgi:Ca2+-binding RTX toxin-like protein
MSLSQIEVHAAYNDDESGASNPDAIDFDPGLSGASPANHIYDQPIIVTQTTNYSNWLVGNNSAIQFETTANSTATFTEAQLNNPGQIDSNAEIIGDSHNDTLAVNITGTNYYGGWGFQGTNFQLENWAGADKFVITLVGATLPADTYVDIEGTSGNDTINMGAYFNYYSLIDGEGGYNTLKIAENYIGNLDTIHNIQQLDLAGGFSYEIGTGSNPAPSGQAFTVDAAALGAGDTLEFVASDDPLGTYIFDGGAGTNDITLNNQADIVNCGTGTNDIIDNDGVLNAGTRIVGAGSTTLELSGDYSAGYTFGAHSFTNITQLNLDGGNSYKLTTNDANVAAGATLAVDATALGTGDSLYFNGSHETNGSFDIEAGAGLNTLYGGAQDDTFEFFGNGAFTAADHVNGEGGNNTLFLDGDYSAGLTFASATIANIQSIELAGGYSYKLTPNNANVAAGQTLGVYATGLGSTDTLVFNGSHVTNGNLSIYGGAGNDTLTGGGAVNTFDGGGGADTMTAGSGADTFVYDAVTDSTSTGHDTIVGFNALTDQFELQNFLQNPNAIDPAITTGTLTTANFDANLAHFVGASELHAGDAVLYTPSAGNLSGHTFLIIDENGVAGYQAGQDIVVELTGATNLSQFSVANFHS